MGKAYQAVLDFEKELCSFCGCKYAVCVDSCTNALFLSCLIKKMEQESDDIIVNIPRHTFPSVLFSVHHAGFNYKLSHIDWTNYYKLSPLSIYDSALYFCRGMLIDRPDDDYLWCLSFQYNKSFSLGKGGAILTNNYEYYKKLRGLAFDGRSDWVEDWKNTQYDCLGYHMNMIPEVAKLGIEKIKTLPDKNITLDTYVDLVTLLGNILPEGCYES